jgi:uncharacterized Fe-S cluster protein YjdI/CDGSH-type Zn-finger protein
MTIGRRAARAHTRRHVATRRSARWSTTQVEAGRPRTRGAIRAYENERIRVHWDATRCIHVARCLRRLPDVFDLQARPWIDVDGAPAADVAATVLTCPTGALRYEPLDGDLPAEQPEPVTTVEVRPNGPLYVRGRLQVTRPDGAVLADEHRLALCRCGASENKPFCDNSHRLVGFRDPPARHSPWRPPGTHSRSAIAHAADFAAGKRMIHIDDALA